MKERTQQIQRLKTEGKTTKEISKTFGISYQRVYQLLKVLHKDKFCLHCKVLLGEKDGVKYCYKCSELSDSKKSSRDLLRGKVRLRDNHTCQKCFKIWDGKSRKFDVHHTVFKPGIDEGRMYKNNKNIDELITLCHHCHMNLHAELRKQARS